MTTATRLYYTALDVTAHSTNAPISVQRSTKARVIFKYEVNVSSSLSSATEPLSLVCCIARTSDLRLSSQTQTITAGATLYCF